MGQVAMATSHGNWQTMWIDGAGSPIRGQLLGLPKKDEKRMRGDNIVPRDEQRVGNTSGSASKGATGVVSGCCEMYYP